MADKQAKAKAEEMLTKYLDGQEPVLYHSCTGVIVSRQSSNSYRRKFFTIDGIRDGQGRGSARVVDVTLYVANLCGLRMDNFGNATGRFTPHEICSMVEQKIARAVKLNSL